MNTVQRYRDIIAWQKGMDLSAVYGKTAHWPEMKATASGDRIVLPCDEHDSLHGKPCRTWWLVDCGHRQMLCECLDDGVYT